MRRAVVASVVGLGVVGSLAVPASVPVASPASRVATVLPTPPAEEPRMIFAGEPTVPSPDTAVDLWDLDPAAGTDLRRLVDTTGTAVEGLARDEDPSYAPDGRRAVLSATAGEGEGAEARLMVAGLIGLVLGADPATTAQPLPSEWQPGLRDVEPDWSPAGGEIAFVRWDVEGDSQDLVGLGVLDVAAGTVGYPAEDLPALDGVTPAAPDWSPDGSRIVLVADTGNGVGELWVLDLGEEEPQAYAVVDDAGEPVIGRDPVWSPDGTRLVFVDSTGGVLLGAGLSEPAPGDPSLEAVVAERYTPPAEGAQLLALADPAWSPDGEEVTVAAIESDDEADTSGRGLFAVAEDGSTRTVLGGIEDDSWLSLQSPDYQPWSDLTVELEASATSGIEPGELVELTATVTNQGPSPAWGAMLELELPGAADELASPVGWPADCEPDDGTVFCELTEPLPVGEPVELTVTTVLPEPGSYTASALITARSVDEDTTNNVASLVLDAPFPPAAGTEPRLAFSYVHGEEEGRRLDVADVLAADGSDFRLLVDEEVTEDGVTARPEESSPSYSPDGRRLVVSSQPQDLDDGTFPAGRVLVVADVGPGPVGARNVTVLDYDHPDGAEDRWPAWSPTGEEVAFVRQYEGGSLLAFVGLDAPEVRELDVSVADLSWAPDGRRLAVATGDFYGEEALAVVHRDDGLARLVLAPSPECSGEECLEPVFAREVAWSPDGTRLAYVADGSGSLFTVTVGPSTTTAEGEEVYVVGAPVLVAEDGGPDYPVLREPTWALDSGSLTVAGSEGEGQPANLLTVPASGGWPAVPLREVMPGIAPDAGEPVYQPWADVGVTLGAAGPLAVGSSVTLRATVTNHGPSPAWGTAVTVELPVLAAGDAVLESWPSQCLPGTGVLTCALPGALPAGESVPLEAVVRVEEPGAHAVRAEAGSRMVDPQPGNDSAVATVDARTPPEPTLEPHLAFTRQGLRQEDTSRDVADVPSQGGPYDLARLLAHQSVSTPEGDVLHPDESHPAYSPDGTRLAFSVSSGEALGSQPVETRLAVGDLVAEPVPAEEPALTNVRLLTYPTEPGTSDGEPVWSPDGEWIAFSRTGFYGDARLYLLAVDTGQLRELTLPDGVGFEASAPSWSPDGERLAVEVDASETSELWVVHLADGTWYPVGDVVDCDGEPCVEPVRGVAPAWSPDGGRIAVGDGRLYPEDPNGPDRSAVVVHDLPAAPSGGGYAVTASRVLAGTSASDDAELPPGALEAVWHPAWSPDGEEISAVGRAVGESWHRLYSFPAAGGEPVARVAEWDEGTPGYYADPTYQPWSDVELTLQGPGGEALAGVPTVLTATVTNHGPSPAWGTEVTLEVPDGHRVTAASPGCTVAGGTVTCTRAEPLVPGADLAIEVTVLFFTPGRHEVTGSLTTTTLDPQPGNDADTVVVDVAQGTPGTGTEPRLAFGYVPDGGVPPDVADVFWADGSEFRVLADRVVPDPDGRRLLTETHPSYSPDGRRMVLTADADVAGLQQLLVGRTRPGLTGLVDVAPLSYDRVPGTSDEEPAWSPDGTRIAFVRSDGEQSRLAVVDVATGDVRVLDTFAGGVELPPQVTSPTWSPDGARLLVAADGLWVVHLAGADAEVHPVLHADPLCPGTPGSCDEQLIGWDPAWSPDGTHVAFVGEGEGGATLYSLALPAAPEAGAYRVSLPQALAEPADLAGPADPDWSLDGTSVAVVAQGPVQSGTDAIVTVPAGGGTPTVLREEVVPGLAHRFAELDHQPWADVGVAVGVPAAVRAGEAFDATVTVTNHGPSPAWGVEVTVLLPGGAEHVTAVPPGCTATGGGLRCTAPQTMPVGATHVVTVPLRAADPGDHEVTAAVTSRMVDPVPGNDTATATFTVTTVVLLLADVGVDVALAQPTGWVGGDPVRATVVVTNSGAGTAPGVVLTLTHPPAVAADPAALACSAGDPCALGDLAPGESRTVTVDLLPVAAGDGPVTATARTAAIDVNTGNDTDSADLTVLLPELRLLPSVATPGEATLAYGVDFPPGAQLTLRWDRGLTAWIRPVTVEPDGTVRVPLLVLPGDELGERVATATAAAGPGFGDVPAPTMLVVPQSSVPPDFLTRG